MKNVIKNGEYKHSTKRKIVYISGKITGTDDYMERFDEAEKKLSEAGYMVINPARIMQPVAGWMDYWKIIDICVAMVKVCDIIFMLNGWEDSTGASTERTFAKMAGIKVWEEGGLKHADTADEKEMV